MDRDAYSPLPGRVSGPLYSARMYRGQDHLLKSTVQGFHEHYRRFAWEDIQGFIVEETPWNGVVNVLLILVLIMQVVSYLTFTDKDWRVALLYLPFIGLISGLMLINLRRGATCKVYLQTAVTRERLWSLNRLKVAMDFVESVAPLIRERQDAARTGSEAEPAIQEIPALEAGGEASAPRPAPVPDAGPLEREQGRWHLAGIVLIGWFLFANLIDSRLSHTNKYLSLLNLPAFAASCMICLAALVSQSRHRTPRPVRILGFLLLAYHGLLTMLALGNSAATLAEVFRNPASATHPADPRLAPTYFPVLYFQMVLQVALLAFGGSTLARLRRLNREDAAVARPPTPA